MSECVLERAKSEGCPCDRGDAAGQEDIADASDCHRGTMLYWLWTILWYAKEQF